MTKRKLTKSDWIWIAEDPELHYNYTVEEFDRDVAALNKLRGYGEKKETVQPDKKRRHRTKG
jgi:hypothetical protein